MKLTTVLLAAVAAAALLLAPVTASARHHHGWRAHHGWHSHWRHGMFVPFGWRHYAWVDWRRYRFLHDPGRYHWVYVDDQYVLVDDRGLIIEVAVF